VTGASAGGCATVKYNSAGQEQWVVRYETATPTGIAVDGSGNVFDADKAVIVCDEGRRNELIAQRQRLLTEKPATGRTVEAAAPATLPKQQTQSSEDSRGGMIGLG
jgi:hypothetical protein